MSPTSECLKCSWPPHPTAFPHLWQHSAAAASCIVIAYSEAALSCILHTCAMQNCSIAPRLCPPRLPTVLLPPAIECHSELQPTGSDLTESASEVRRCVNSLLPNCLTVRGPAPTSVRMRPALAPASPSASAANLLTAVLMPGSSSSWHSGCMTSCNAGVRLAAEGAGGGSAACC